MSTHNGERQSLAALYGDFVTRLHRARTECIKTQSDYFGKAQTLSETIESLDHWATEIDLRRNRNLLAQMESSDMCTAVCNEIRRPLTECRLALEHVELLFNIRTGPASDGCV
jgi:hypothetical protein